ATTAVRNILDLVRAGENSSAANAAQPASGQAVQSRSADVALRELFLGTPLLISTGERAPMRTQRFGGAGCSTGLDAPQTAVDDRGRRLQCAFRTMISAR